MFFFFKKKTAKSTKTKKTNETEDYDNDEDKYAPKPEKIQPEKVNWKIFFTCLFVILAGLFVMWQQLSQYDPVRAVNERNLDEHLHVAGYSAMVVAGAFSVLVFMHA